MSTALPNFLTTPPITAPPPNSGPYRLADYLALPDEPRVELIDGEYVMSPAPITLHQILSGELHYLLQVIAKASGGQVLAAPTDVVFADNSCVQPDLLYFRKDRRPPIGPRIESAPDLVIEILSPSHHARDRVTKADLYAKHGVAEYWIVDPDERTFEFMVLVASPDGTGGKYQRQPLPIPPYTSPVCCEIQIDLPAFWVEIDRQLQPPK